MNTSKKVLIEVGHPNDVHQFKNLYHELLDIGWQVLFLAKKKDIVIELLDAYKLPYKIFAKTPESILGKIVTLPLFHLKYLLKALKFKPDFILSRNSPHSAHISRLLKVYHIGFADTENSGLVDKMAINFVDIFFTSFSFSKIFPQNQFYYPGYIETWYLHPKRFKPNPNVLDLLGLKEGEHFSVLRFVSWKAHHDVGIEGLSDEFKIKLVNRLLSDGRVFISSEKQLPEQLEKYRFKLPPEMMHDVLYYATFFYGESATMASECAMLGTPAIFIDPRGVGYTHELEKKYGLVYNYKLDEDSLVESLNKIDELLQLESLKKEYLKSHKLLLSEVIDPVAYVTWYIVNYPESFEMLKRNPDYWEHFK